MGRVGEGGVCEGPGEGEPLRDAREQALHDPPTPQAGALHRRVRSHGGAAQGGDVVGYGVGGVRRRGGLRRLHRTRRAQAPLQHGARHRQARGEGAQEEELPPELAHRAGARHAQQGERRRLRHQRYLLHRQRVLRELLMNARSLPTDQGGGV